MKTLLLLALVASFVSTAQASEVDARERAPKLPLYIWQVESLETKWLLFVDVFHGGDQADPNDMNNYLSVAVAIDRVTKKAAFVSFQLSGVADKETGLSGVLFNPTAKGSELSVESETSFELEFDGCAEACVVRVINGEARDKHAERIDLLKGLLTHSHLLVRYGQSGEQRSALLPLSDLHDKYAALK